MDNIAMSIYKESVSSAEVKYKMMKAARHREYAQAHMTMNSRICPACGCGLKIRVFPNPPMTYMTCPSCGAMKTFPIAMDEGREIGEEYIPGVTPGSKETIKVFMSPDGKVKSIKRTK